MTAPHGLDTSPAGTGGLAAVGAALGYRFVTRRRPGLLFVA